MLRKGFTLIELMIVIAIIAIIAAIAIPNLLESRITANENAAAASLKSAIFAGQTQFQSGTYNDLDGDNTGEYGYFSQMTGQEDAYGTMGPDEDGDRTRIGIPVQARDGGVGANAAALSFLGAEFDSDVGTMDCNQVQQGANPPAAGSLVATTAADQTTGIQCARDSISGYVFGVLLASVGTDDFEVAENSQRINLNEKYFAVAAYPETFGDTGRRAYTITQTGKVYTTAPTPQIAGVNFDSPTDMIAPATAVTGAQTRTGLVFEACFATTVALAGAAGADGMALGVDGAGNALPTVRPITAANRTPAWKPAAQ